MNDKELKDKVMALGDPFPKLDDLIGLELSPYLIDQNKAFVRDPRVAMALLEKACHNKLMQVERWDDSIEWAVDFGGSACADNESLPRAITEACVEALS